MRTEYDSIVSNSLTGTVPIALNENGQNFRLKLEIKKSEIEKVIVLSSLFTNDLPSKEYMREALVILTYFISKVLETRCKEFINPITDLYLSEFL